MQLTQASRIYVAGHRSLVGSAVLRGTPRRAFLHVDDLADAVLYLLHSYDAEAIVNIGWGQDVTIRELAELVCRRLATVAA